MNDMDGHNKMQAGNMGEAMRRKEREITDPQEIDEIIKKCDCLRLGLMDEKCPYIVPMNFGFEHTKEGRVFYFHGSGTGRKKTLLEKLEFAGFELDREIEIVESDVACKYTCHFESIIGSGRIKIIEKAEEKIYALDRIMGQYSDKKDWTYPQGMIEKIFIFTLTVEELRCKAYRG